MRGLFQVGEDGFMRRMPIACHIGLVAFLLAIVQIMRPSFLELLIEFNKNGGFDVISALSLVFILLGFVVTLVLLSSTKIVVDWIIDGK